MKPFASLLALVLLSFPVLAAEPDEVAKARKRLDADPVVKEVDDDRAKALLDAIEEAEDADEPDALPKAIEPLVTARHEDFVKPLLKLAKDREPAVRLVATRALGSQDDVKKIGPQLVALIRWKPNDDYPKVLAAAVESMRRLEYDHPLAEKEIESHFRKRADLDLMRECVRWYGALKKKEAVSDLIQWVEAPQPANVNSGSNPPASYWKRMWEIWDAIKEAVWVALSDITEGRYFRTEQEWREWLGTREAKQMGF